MFYAISVLSILFLVALTFILSSKPVFVSSRLDIRIREDDHDKPIKDIPLVIVFIILLILLSYNWVACILGIVFLYCCPCSSDEMFFSCRDRHSIRPLHCQGCKKPLARLDSALDFLTAKEEIASMIGNIFFEAWQCENCSNCLDEFPSRDLIHLRGYVKRWGSPYHCRDCEELTATNTVQIIEEPTEHELGKEFVVNECHYCGKKDEYYSKIPKIIPEHIN